MWSFVVGREQGLNEDFRRTLADGLAKTFLAVSAHSYKYSERAQEKLNSVNRGLNLL